MISKISSQLISKKEIIIVVFKELNVEAGKIYRDRKVLIGVDAEDKEVCLYDFRSVRIDSIESISLMNSRFGV